MQSVGEDDSDEESFAFVVPSRHGSPREPSPRIPVLYNVGKEKPRPPPGRPPVKKDASAAVAAANAMWDAMATDPEALAGQNAMATDPIVRGAAQRDSFDAGRCACDARLARSMAAWEGCALCFVGTINPTPESSESDSEESLSDDKFSTGRARFFGGGFLGGAGFRDRL